MMNPWLLFLVLRFKNIFLFGKYCFYFLIGLDIFFNLFIFIIEDLKKLVSLALFLLQYNGKLFFQRTYSCVQIFHDNLAFLVQFSLFFQL